MDPSIVLLNLGLLDTYAFMTVCPTPLMTNYHLAEGGLARLVWRVRGYVLGECLTSRAQLMVKT